MKSSRTFYVLVFLFLSACAMQAGHQQELVTQTPVSASAHGPGDPSATPPRKKVFAVTLPHSLDVKNLNSGAIFQVSRDVYDASAASPETFLGHVAEAQEKGHENQASLLVVGFEKVTLVNKQEVHEHLRLEAIVAPPNMHISPSPVIVDRYPCDYEANPVGCKEKEDNETDMPKVAMVERSICTENPKPSQGQAKSDCVSLTEASGAYGFPDFTLSAHSGDTGFNSAIASSKRNVRFEPGTYFVLSELSPDSSPNPQH
jgi:hypothetical protein